MSAFPRGSWVKELTRLVTPSPSPAQPASVAQATDASVFRSNRGDTVAEGEREGKGESGKERDCCDDTSRHETLSNYSLNKKYSVLLLGFLCSVSECTTSTTYV